MNILYVVPYVPSRIRVRPYSLIKSLTARGHQVTVLTLVNGKQERQDARALSQICERVESFYQPKLRSLINSALTLPSRQPLQAVYSWQANLANRLLELASSSEKYDLIHVEHLRGVNYGLHYLNNQAGPRRLPVIWDSVDSISLLFRLASERSRSFFGRWLTRLELSRTENYEGKLVGKFDGMTVASPRDQEAFLALADPQDNHALVTVLPNGVDLDYFQEDPSVIRQPAELVLSGKMSYHANISMALYLVETILPLIWKERPEVRLTIVGKDPPRQILDLAQQPQIQVTGSVADIRPYLHCATISVAPLPYGVGIQNKVLEAMACGTPVVASPVAASALQARPGQDLLVAESPADFARAVLGLLADRAWQSRMGGAGRRYVETYHRWDSIAGRLEQVYTQAIRYRVLDRHDPSAKVLIQEGKNE